MKDRLNKMDDAYALVYEKGMVMGTKFMAAAGKLGAKVK